MSRAEDSGIIAMPPHIVPNYMQLTVGILKAEELPDMDSNVFTGVSKTKASCDAFISMNYLGKTLTSKVVKMKDRLVVWNERLNFPFTYPCTSEKIIFQVFDKDAGSGDDLIGSFEVNILDIIDKKYVNPVYVNIYGGPINTEGKFAKAMNENPEIGSNWKGRVLIYMKATETTEPKMGVEKLIVSEDLYKSYQKKNLWNIELDLIDALFLPYTEGKVTFVFAYEGDEQVSGYRTVEKGNILNWNLNKKITFHHLSSKVEELGDLFIYLCEGTSTGVKDRTCFQRIPIKEVFNNKDVLVFRLFSDPAIDKVKGCKALLKMKIKAELVSGNKVISKPSIPEQVQTKVENVTSQVKEITPIINEDSYSSSSSSDDLDALVKKKTIKRDKSVLKTTENVINSNVNNKNLSVGNKGHTIVANVFMSKDFVAGDDTGTSDPFVEVTLNGLTLSTTVKNDQVNAVWNESLIFKNVDFNIDDKSTWPILFFKVLDKDTFGNDDLGYSYIWLSSSAHKLNNLDKFLPQWHQFRLCVSDRPQGKLLISFYILDYTNPNFNAFNNKLANLDISPETKLYSFEVNVLGLRKLEPLGLLPVKKPYIFFDMNSISIPNKNVKDDVQLKSIKTEPLHAGRNPNINTTLLFKVNLPVEDVFMPSLTCIVRDKTLFGLSTDTLGVFSINVSKMIKETKKNLKKDLSVTSKKVGLLSLTKVLGKSLEDDESKIDQAIENNMNDLNEELAKKQQEKEENEKISLLQANDQGKNNNYNNVIEENTERANKDKEEKQKKSKGYTGLVDDEDHKKGDSKIEVLLKEYKEDANNDNNDNVANKEEVVQVSKSSAINKMLKKNTGRSLMNNIIFPSYIEQEVLSDKKKKTTYKVEDPSTIPDPKEFFELGYENPNNIASNGKKHYRRIYYSELENVKELNISSPFIKIPIYRDKFYDSNEFKEVFNQLRSKNKIMRRFNENEEIAPTTSITENNEGNMRKSMLRKSTIVNENNLTTPCHGYFKGLITCMEEDKRKEFFDNIDIIKEKNPALLKDFTHFTKYNELAKSILVKKNLIARVYILELRDLAKKDLLSESDPYIKIRLGDNEIDEQKNHLDDQANAMIYRKFE